MSYQCNLVLFASLLALMMLCNHIAQGYEDTYDGQVLDYESKPQMNWIEDLLARETRGGKRCGKRRCYGLCCGGYRCCKKGWTCRYMNNIRSYTCIP